MSYSRHEVRKFAMQVLYLLDQNKTYIETEKKRELKKAKEKALENNLVFDESKFKYEGNYHELSLSEVIDQVFDNFEKSDDAIVMVNFATLNLEKIDILLNSSLVNYSLDRLNLVDKAILRLAVSEFLNKQIASEIVINEALELTKEFSDQGDNKAVRFNNKVLDTVLKKLN